MTAADKPVMHRPICGCIRCRHRTAVTERRTKRRYYPCETRIIVAEMTRAGATKPQIAAVLDVTTSAVLQLRKTLTAEGTALDKPRHVYRIEAHAENIAAMIQAGESFARISQAVGFDVRKYVFQARKKADRTAAENLIAEAAPPFETRAERMRQWWAGRRAHAASPPAC